MSNEKLTFKEARHMQTGEPIIEIWKGNFFVGCIYFHENHINIVSKYFDSHELKRFPVPHDLSKIGIELKIFFNIGDEK